MAKQRSFDAVTIVGVAVALALMWYGQKWMKDRQAERQAANPPAPVNQVDEHQPAAPNADPKVAATDAKDAKGPGDAPKGDGEKPPAPAVDAEPADAGDVVVSNDVVKAVFSAKGATFVSAALVNAYADPTKKDSKGLELLSEIEAGKRAFGLPNFVIGAQTEAEKSRLTYTGATGANKSLDQRVWKLDSSSGNFDNGGWKVVYSTTLNNEYTVTKTFTVPQSGNNVLMALSVENNSGKPAVYSYTLNGPMGVLLDGPKEDPKGGANFMIIGELAGRDADESNPEVKPVDTGTTVKAVEDNISIRKPDNLWGAVKNRFYMAMLVSLQPHQIIRLGTIPIAHGDQATDDKRLTEPNLGVTALRYISEPIDDKKSATDKYAMYLGPNDEDRLQEAEDALKPAKPVFMRDVVQYCDFLSATWRWPRIDWVARKMMLLFKAFQNVFGSFGVAVILLTLVIKVCMHPMQRNMQISMDKMAKLKPELDKITAKYKDQTSTEAKMKMSLEQRDLQAKAGVNPVAGCLPMFIQIPMFSALYGIFNHAFQIRGAEFLWIKDLSRQDNFMSIPFYPHVINLLPLLYMVMTLLMTRLNPPPPTEDPAQEQQRKMMMFMPVLFSFMFYRMPAGLVLYFAANAFFGMIETWYIRKYLIKPPAPPAAGATVTPSPNPLPAK